jgi:predicted metal-dependent peptidase
MASDFLAGVKGRLLKARTQLLLDEPFYGTLLMQLKMVEDRKCKTMWVDGVSIGYNPKFVAQCTDEELKGTLCHEVEHVTRGHCWRRKGRDHKDWNYACDYAINPDVLKAGFVLPEGALADSQFSGQPAEQVYDTIHKPKPEDDGPPQGGQGADDEESKDESGSADNQQKNETDENSKSSDDKGQAGESDDESDQDSSSDGNPSEGGEGTNSDDGVTDGDSSGSSGEGEGDEEGDPEPAGEVRDAPADKDPKALEQQWKLAVDQAARAARMRGKLPGDLQRIVEDILKPSIAWDEVMRQFVQQSWTAADYSWRTPSTRYLAQGLYMPRLASETLPCIIIAFDTSASIWGRLLAAFQAEVQAIADEIRPEKTFIVYCDAAVQKVDEFAAGEPVRFDHRGGGGTEFAPVFDWVEKEGHAPACLVYLTDLDGGFPEVPPEYPVLWVTPPTRLRAPFGDHVEMQI